MISFGSFGGLATIDTFSIPDLCLILWIVMVLLIKFTLSTAGSRWSVRPLQEKLPERGLEGCVRRLNARLHCEWPAELSDSRDRACDIREHSEWRGRVDKEHQVHRARRGLWNRADINTWEENWIIVEIVVEIWQVFIFS